MVNVPGAQVGGGGSDSGGFVDGADIGYSSAGIASLLENIKAIMITKAKDEIENKRADLDAALDKIWNGNSEEQFKANMQADAKKIQDALDLAYTSLESEVAQVGQEMGRIDDKLVQERK